MLIIILYDPNPNDNDNDNDNDIIIIERALLNSKNNFIVAYHYIY